MLQPGPEKYFGSQRSAGIKASSKSVLILKTLTANDYSDLSLLNSPSSLQEKILGTASSWQRVPTVAV